MPEPDGGGDVFKRLGLSACAIGAVLSVAAASEAATRSVCASGCDYQDVQAAIDAAQPGDTILLRAGETFVGHYRLRRKSGTGVITIRSDAPDSELPGPGVRLVPNTRSGGNTPLNRLPRLVGRGATYRTTPIFQTEVAANGYRLQFLEIDGSRQEGYETLIALGTNSSTQTSTSQAPSNLVLDRLYVHGDPVRGQKRCLALNSASTDVLNSYFEHCRHFAEDSQAIAGFNGPGPFRIENNYLEASTMSILFGGADPRIPNLVPSDITIRRNHLTKQLSWRNPVLSPPGSPRAAAASGGSLGAGTHYFKVVAFMDSSGSRAYSLPSSQVSVSLSGSNTAATISWSAVTGALRYRIFRGTSSNGQSRYMDTSGAGTTFTYTGSGESSGTPPTRATMWNVKNALELKNAQRVLIEGNLIEHVWSASQNGYAILFTPRNQDNTAPWTVVQDVTMRYNLVRRVGGGVNILGYDYSAGTGSGRTRRITLRHNVFDEIGGSWASGTHWVLITSGPTDVVLDHNTVFQTGHVVSIDNGTSSGFVFTNNMTLHSSYGVFGSGAGTGTGALDAYFPGAVFRRNVLAGGQSSLYPADNYFPSVSTFYAQFVGYSTGDYRLVSTSPYLAAGTDSLPLGADYRTLLQIQAGSTSSPTPTTNAAPTAVPGGPYSGAPGAAIRVDGSGSRDSDGTIASYRWSWGDGTSDSTGATPSHTYAQAGTYTIRLTVTDDRGATASAATTATIASGTTTGAGDIVLTAQDVTVVRGNWARTSSSGSPGGQAMTSADRGWNTNGAPLASPADYFEASFVPVANTTYRVWVRLRAPSDASDSVWMQFTGSVDGSNVPLWRVGTTNGLFVNLAACSGCQPSGWGWEDNAWWIDTPSTVRFRSSAPQTIRVQTREDGVQVDTIVLSPSTYLSRAPGAISNDGTVLTRTGATLTPRDVVLRARDAVRRRGNWSEESDSTAADGRRLGSADRGWSSTNTALASPTDFVEATFSAVAGVPYRVWLRLSATGNSKWNDSVWVQYSGTVNGSGSPVLRIGSTSAVLVNRERCYDCGLSGWGWYDSNWWNGQTGMVTFGTTGVQTIRIQTREDGVRIDQVVISPDRYRSGAPGRQDGDTLILPY